MVLAAHDRQLKRPVVIKMLPPRMAAHPSVRRRFIREALSLAAFNHPNLVTIFDVVLTPGGAFMVMERVEGRSLHRLIPRRGFTLLTALNLAIQLADALATMHAGGWAHRDVKPSNILVNPAGLLKLLDFGAAKVTKRHAPVLTAPGIEIGTTGYMAPEQLRGGPVDHRVDIFSFGVVLSELLTGGRPFDGPSPADIAAAILRDPPISRPKRLPNAAVQIMARCLEKNPRLRYQTIRTVVRDLKALRTAWQACQRQRGGG